MRGLARQLRRLALAQDGASAIEYAMIAALLALGSVSLIAAIGSDMNNLWFASSQVTAQVNAQSTSVPGPAN